MTRARLLLAILLFAVGCMGRPVTKGELLDFQAGLGKQVRAQQVVVQKLADQMTALELATAGDRAKYLKNSEVNAQMLQEVSKSLSVIAQRFEGMQCVPTY